MTPTLVGLSYSSWTIKARWALDAHGAAYRYREYLPMIGEPALRLKLRAPLSKPSVPVLFTDDGPLTDSWDIALWSARQAAGASLIPDAERDAIAAWNAAGERISAAGRARTSRGVLTDPAALATSVPPPLNKLGPVTRAIGAAGANFLLWKYDASDVTVANAEQTFRDELDALRAALDGRETLLDAFSYADIAMACAFLFIDPPADAKISRAARPYWTCAAVAEDYADLVAWSRTIWERRP